MKYCEYSPWGHIHNSSFALLLMNGLKKVALQNTSLERLAREKPSSLLWQFVSHEENENEEHIHNTTFSS